jgi:hypothetical protein
MKFALIAAGLAVGLAACETGGEVETDANTGMAVDTVITEQTVQDTSMVTYDTSVTVDTVEGGDATVQRDTVMDTRGQVSPAPTTQQPGQQPSQEPMQQSDTLRMQADTAGAGAGTTP